MVCDAEDLDCQHITWSATTAGLATLSVRRGLPKGWGRLVTMRSVGGQRPEDWVFRGVSSDGVPRQHRCKKSPHNGQATTYHYRAGEGGRRNGSLRSSAWPTHPPTHPHQRISFPREKKNETYQRRPKLEADCWHTNFFWPLTHQPNRWAIRESLRRVRQWYARSNACPMHVFGTVACSGNGYDAGGSKRTGRTLLKAKHRDRTPQCLCFSIFWGSKPWQAGEARSPEGTREISRSQGSELPNDTIGPLSAFRAGGLHVHGFY